MSKCSTPKEYLLSNRPVSPEQTEPAGERPENKDFIRSIVAEDQRQDTYYGKVVTRFPPEPNGYPHIGHAKSICLNFGIAQDFDGVCNLRMDDTNPETESMEYVRALEEAIQWLGFEWGGETRHASDYFEQLYQFARQLIMDGRLYVDSLSEEEIRDYRGTVTEAGRESPYRNRTVAENLELFERMRKGEFADGAHVLRAKGDMASPNMKMRDPLLYRIRHTEHYRTGSDWPIYPMYDFAHPLSDAIEGVTHSVCTLEFENNRHIYDWLMEAICEPPRPQQYEFARLNIDYTVLSKRKLLELVEDKHVNGWDDPRLPTIAGLRRRGYTPAAIRDFCDRIGVAKVNSRVDMALLEFSIRDDLNQKAPRVMCVLRPIKVVITNWPEDHVELLDASYWPHDVPREGSRNVPLGREIHIERDDFMEDPPKKFFRLAPGQEVRLRYGYIIKCNEVIKDEAGEVIELRCTYDPDTRSSGGQTGRRVQGTIHWVSAAHALPAEVRLYDRLFTAQNPEDGDAPFTEHLNPGSLEILTDSLIEPSVADAAPGTHYQFERQGYFVSDPVDSAAGHLVFNRTVTLRDSWGKEESKSEAKAKREETAEVVHVGSRSEVRDRARNESPELAALYQRFQQELGLDEADADILTGALDLANFYASAIDAHSSPSTVASWAINELMGELKERSVDELPFAGKAFGALVALVDDETISAAGGKRVLGKLLKDGGNPAEIVEKLGLKQISEPSALAPIIDQIMTDNADKVEQYRSGKHGLLGFFVGQAMRATKGAANPQMVQGLVKEKLEG